MAIVQSDSNYLNSELSNLMSRVEELESDITSFSLSLSSSNTHVPFDVNSITYKKVQTALDLIDDFKREIKAIRVVGASIEDLDNILKEETELLNQTDIIFIEEEL